MYGLTPLGRCPADRPRNRAPAQCGEEGLGDLAPALIAGAHEQDADRAVRGGSVVPSFGRGLVPRGDGRLEVELSSPRVDRGRRAAARWQPVARRSAAPGRRRDRPDRGRAVPAARPRRARAPSWRRLTTSRSRATSSSAVLAVAVGLSRGRRHAADRLVPAHRGRRDAGADRRARRLSCPQRTPSSDLKVDGRSRSR